MTAETNQTFTKLIELLKPRANEDNRFASCMISDGMLVCRAAASAEPADYRVELEGGRLWVSLVMKDRWQSESIEADLMHSGDKLEELLEEELVDLGHEPGGKLSYEHYRSDDMLFTFRSPVPVSLDTPPTDETIDTALTWLRSYEACFSQLGDMSAEDEDDD